MNPMDVGFLPSSFWGLQNLGRGLFLCVSLVINSMGSDPPSLQFLCDKISSNQKALGNADVSFALELKLFNRVAVGEQRLPELSSLTVLTQYAKDGSFSSKLDGDVSPGSARFYLSKDGGLLRYFEHVGSAYNQVASTSSPDWTIDPFECLRTGKHVSVLDAMLNPKFNVSEIIWDDQGNVVLRGDLPSKAAGRRVFWVIHFSKENDFLPVQLEISVVRNGIPNKVLDASVVYQKVLRSGSLFPERWKRINYSSTSSEISSEEIGQITNIELVSSFERSSIFANLPDGTKFIDAVSNTVSVVKPKDKRGISTISYGLGVVFCVAVSFVVLLLVRRRK